MKFLGRLVSLIPFRWVRDSIRGLHVDKKSSLTEILSEPTNCDGARKMQQMMEVVETLRHVSRRSLIRHTHCQLYLRKAFRFVSQC